MAEVKRVVRATGRDHVHRCSVEERHEADGVTVITYDCADCEYGRTDEWTGDFYYGLA